MVKLELHFIMGCGQMIKKKTNKDYLVQKLYWKLALLEIERQFIKISCNLMDDEEYTVDDAVHELIEVISLIEMEREGVSRDIEYS